MKKSFIRFKSEEVVVPSWSYRLATAAVLAGAMFMASATMEYEGFTNCILALLTVFFVYMGIYYIECLIKNEKKI